MRALLWLDAGAGPVGGQVVQGHIIQAERTAAALRDTQGIDAEVSTDEHAEVHRYDVVHGLGAKRELLRTARLAGVPVAVSPVYWSAAYVLGETALGTRSQDLTRQGRRRVRVAGSVLRRGTGPAAFRIMDPLMQRALDLECADLLLPNSMLEAAAIVWDLKVTTPSHVVPNGVDSDVFQMPELETSRENVLFVGRIEPHKNQLGLLRAMKLLPYDLTLVGPPHPHHSDYFEACRREAGPNVTFEVAKSHDELRALYQAARVHVLPSFFETTGLVSLEAALSGCRIATTERGFAREYLGDYATYLNPADPASIARAVNDAWHRQDDPALRERVMTHYTWPSVAAATRAAYERIASRL